MVTSRIILAVCEHLRERAAAAVAHEGFDDVMLATFPAGCSIQATTKGTLADILADIETNAANDPIYVIGGPCLASLAPSLQQHNRYKIHRVDQRYQLECDRKSRADWLPPVVARVVLAAQLERERSESREFASRMKRQSADYAMAYDVMARLTKVMNEAEAIESIMSLFTTLFAPKKLTYISVFDGKVGSVYGSPIPVSDGEETGGQRTADRITDLAEEYGWPESEQGFTLPISHQGEVLGLLRVDEIAFPEYREHYLNLGLAMVSCCGLAIANARTYEKIKEMENILATERERLEVTLQSIGDGVIATDIEGRILLMNRVSEHLTGWTQDEARGRLLGEVFHIVNEKTREVAESPVDKTLKTGQVVGLANDTALIAKDGTERSIADSAAPIRDEQGRILGVVLVFRDVTENKQATIEHDQLLAEVQRRAAELGAANKELEAFSYSVSHDLRAPLRHIEGFTKILQRAYVDKLDEQSQEYFGFVLQGTERMSQLIDGLLSLSRIARSDIRYERVNLSELTQQIAKELADEEAEREVSILIAPGVMVDGDSRLLRIVVENLMRNAWKFSSNNERARIEFGVSSSGGKPAYYVRDNGAGFDMAYADKLFAPFQRLHSDEEFSGTGIGLATVQRILHRHGGRIWAEGEIDKGATFYFTVS